MDQLTKEICTQWIHVSPKSQLSFRAGFLEDLSEIYLQLQGATEIQGALLELFQRLDGSPQEIELFNNFILKVDPSRIGAFLQLSEKGAIDLGWSIEEKIPTHYIFELEKNSKVFNDLRKYTLERGVDSIVYCGRDVGLFPNNETTIGFISPGKDLFEQTEGFKDLFQLLDVPTFPDWVWLLLFSCKEGSFQTRITLNKSFVTKIAVRAGLTPTVLSEISKRENVVSQMLSSLDEEPYKIELQMLRSEAAYGVYRKGFRLV